jgi:transcriptional regulator with XRE-family HTH domain
MMMVGHDGPEGEYGRKVGERLRAIRRQKRMSLQEVEATSKQEFKASVLGAYERGERAISVPRLQRLARFYSVPVDQLLPGDEGPDFGHPEVEDETIIDLTDSAQATQLLGGITIDITKLDTISGPEAGMLNRYLTMIQVQRQDFNGRVLTIRRDDLQALAAILGTDIGGAQGKLGALGLRHEASGAPADASA